MKYESSGPYSFIMIYDNRDITYELFNFIEKLDYGMFEHFNSKNYQDCLLLGDEMESLKIFMSIYGIFYEESDKIFEEK